MRAESKPKIFIFENCRNDFGVNGLAIAEDGEILDGHLSSDRAWLMRDMGFRGSEWKHDSYRKKYPDGFELEFVTYEEVANHAGIQAAFKRADEQRPEANAS